MPTHVDLYRCDDLLRISRILQGVQDESNKYAYSAPVVSGM